MRGPDGPWQETSETEDSGDRPMSTRSPASDVAAVSISSRVSSLAPCCQSPSQPGLPNVLPAPAPTPASIYAPLPLDAPIYAPTPLDAPISFEVCIWT